MLRRWFEWVDSGDEAVDEWIYQVCKMVILFAIVVAIFFITGCANQQELQTLVDNNKNIVEAQSLAAGKELKTLTIDCSQGGCGKAIITYIDPRDRQKVSGTRVRGTNDVIVESMPEVTNIIGWVAGAWAASDVVRSLANSGGSGNTTTTNNNDNRNSTDAVNNNTNTKTQAGDTISNDGNVANRDTITTTEDNDTTNTTTTTLSIDSNDTTTADSNDTTDDNSTTTGATTTTTTTNP